MDGGRRIPAIREGADTPLITRIHSTPVVVSDQERALEFYTRVLGWEKDIDHDMGNGMRFLTVRPPGGDTVLSLGTPEMHGRPVPGAEPRHTGISLAGTDVRATFDDFRALGVRIIQEPEEMSWGTVGGHFADPDGNVFFVAEERADES